MLNLSVGPAGSPWGSKDHCVSVRGLGMHSDSHSLHTLLRSVSCPSFDLVRLLHHHCRRAVGIRRCCPSEAARSPTIVQLLLVLRTGSRLHQSRGSLARIISSSRCRRRRRRRRQNTSNAARINATRAATTPPIIGPMCELLGVPAAPLVVPWFAEVPVGASGDGRPGECPPVGEGGSPCGSAPVSVGDERFP